MVSFGARQTVLSFSALPASHCRGILTEQIVPEKDRDKEEEDRVGWSMLRSVDMVGFEEKGYIGPGKAVLRLLGKNLPIEIT